MVLVLGVSALVFGFVGAVLGGLMAYYLPRVVLLVFWAALLLGTMYEFLLTRTLDEYERAGANILVFAVLLPLLIGSLIAGILLHRRQK